ncbi:MAG: hypothetical protein EBS65_24440 [Betaproteobacteria bacterium]|nr:hypothetical protein [Betaproteobacteria bacterium]
MSNFIESLSDHDFHLLATALARTINRDIEFLKESESNKDFWRDLQIKRLTLLIKLERSANRGGQGLQMYLTNPVEILNNLVAERDGG